jgi:hypothetical protein
MQRNLVHNKNMKLIKIYNFDFKHFYVLYI